MSQQFLDQAADSDRLLRNPAQPNTAGDFLAKRPLIEEDDTSPDQSAHPVQPARGLIGGVENEQSRAPRDQAPAAPRNWDSLTSRGFLGLKWLFNIGGARDKRNAEIKQRRSAFNDAWNRGGKQGFTDTTGILNSKWARRKLVDKRADMLFAGIHRPSNDMISGFDSDMAKYKQLYGIATRAEAAAKAAKKGKKGAVVEAPAEVASPNHAEAEPSIDQQWHAWAGSQPFGQATAGPGPSALRRPPAKSGMKPASLLQQPAHQMRVYPWASKDLQHTAATDAAQNDEIAAHESFLAAKEADTTGQLAGLDATFRDTKRGKVKITRRKPTTLPAAGAPAGDESDAQSEDAETGVGAAARSASLTPIVPYARAMSRAAEAEKERQGYASIRHVHEQGDLGFPQQIYGTERAEQAAFFNGYWGQEQAQPAPTRKAGHDRHVRFDTGDANFENSMNRPAELLDPEREGSADRVLPTSVNRYLTAKEGAPELSDGEAYASSLKQTRWNRHMASLAPSVDPETAAKHGANFPEDVPVEHFLGSRMMFASRQSKTSSRGDEESPALNTAFAAGDVYHRGRHGRLLPPAMERSAPVPSSEDDNFSRNSLYSLDQMAPDSDDEN